VSLPAFQLDCGTKGNAVPTLLMKCGTAGDAVPTLLRACQPKSLCNIDWTTLSFVFSGPLTIYPDRCIGSDSGYAQSFKMVEVPTAFVIPANVPKATAVDVTATGKLVANVNWGRGCCPSGEFIEHEEAASGFKFAWDIIDYPSCHNPKGFHAWLWLPENGGGNFDWLAPAMVLYSIRVYCDWNPTEGTYGNYNSVAACPGWSGTPPLCVVYNGYAVASGGSMTVTAP
jgi:hypothetical protein